MGEKIRLSMHPRNFGSEKIVCTYVHPTHVSPGEILHLKHPSVSGINRISTRTKCAALAELFLFFSLIYLDLLAASIELTCCMANSQKIKKHEK